MTTAVACSAEITEFAVYRRVRYTQGATQVEAAREYRRRYPAGPHLDDVDRLVPSDDDSFWQRHHEHLADLREYLAEYPEGRHAEEARFLVVARYGGRVDAAHFSALRPQIEATLHDESPDAIAEHWIRLVRAATAWNEPLNAFYGANPPLLRQFQAEPAPVCEPGSCTKTIDTGCAFAHADGSGEVGRTPFRVRMLSYGARIVGFDLYVSQRGAWLWNACTDGQPVERLPGDLDESAVATLARLRSGLLALESRAVETPPSLRPRELDRVATTGLPTSRGRYFWSLLVGCGTQRDDGRANECMRFDGYQSSDDDEVGIRAIAIPTSIVNATRDAIPPPASEPVSHTAMMPGSSAPPSSQSLDPIVVSEATRVFPAPRPMIEATPDDSNGRAEARSAGDRITSRRRHPNGVITALGAFGVIGSGFRVTLDLVAFFALSNGNAAGVAMFLPIVGPIVASVTDPHIPPVFAAGLVVMTGVEVATTVLSLVALGQWHRHRTTRRAMVIPLPVAEGAGVAVGWRW